MVRIIWTPRAANDLASIKSYIEKDSVSVAQLVVKAIYQKVDLLHKFPLMGRILPETNDPDIREIIKYSYRIVYRHYPSDSIVRVLQIRHSSHHVDSDNFS